MVQNNLIQEDEIDLRELFKILWAKKIFIIFVTFLITIGSIIYVFIKNPIPIYEGKVLIEIGEIQSSNFGNIYFDTPNNLSEILKVYFSVTSFVPKGTNKLLELNITNSNQKIIEDKLEKTVKYILQRHQEKADFHKNYIMTKQIGDITINPSPINQPKKKLLIVVSLICGFFLSILLVFFINYMKMIKKEIETMNINVER